MSDKTTTDPPVRRDGLHCVYDKCRGFPYSNRPCHPGCYFQMSAMSELDWLHRNIGDQHE